LCFNQFLLSFILYLRSNISGLLLFRTDSLMSVLDRVLMILICSVLIWGHVTSTPFQIEWFVYAQSAAYLLTALTALLIVIKKAAFKRLNWNGPFFVMIIKQSFPFAILVMLMAFYNRIDPVMIERLLPEEIGDSEAGIYASAFRLLDASNNIAYLFSVLLLPLFARMIKEKESIGQIVRLGFTLLIILSATVAIGSHFYSYEIMDLMYTAHVEESTAVFRILILGFMGVSTSYIFGTLLTANGNLKLLNIVAACGMILNLLINIILVPRFLAVGSAWASLVTQMSMAIIQTIIAIRIFKFKTDIKFVLAVTAFLAGVVIINLISRTLFENWILNFMIMVVGSIGIALILKLLNIKGFIEILKAREPI
jgi:O-antigen/teichoic acid export membrane protein